MSDLVPIPSKAVQVILFEDRAEVTRSARASIEAGSAWIAVGGVSSFVDERSVQARVVGDDGVKVLAARVRFRAHLEKELGRREIEALEREAKAADRALVEARQALDRARHAEARVKGLRAAWITSIAAVPRRAREADTLGAWRDSLAAIEASMLDALAQQTSARAAIADAEATRDRTRARLVEGTIERPRCEAVIEIELAATAAREATIEVIYRVPCALWRPEHTLRLDGVVPPQGKSAPVEIITTATAWQRTGEVWEDIDVRFSTARPARAASPPIIADDWLSSRRKTDEERRRIDVSVREQSIEVAGLDRGTRAVEEMPGVDDGGEPMIFAPQGKVTIASDGRPFRVEVQRVTVDAKIERVLFPELAEVAHLRATATLSKGGPILAGPVRLARGKSLVGRAKIDFVGKGEPFEVGLGIDDGVRVRRDRTEERDVTAVLGTQKIKRKVSVFLSNLSNEPKRVLVAERIPVSEIEDVTVTLSDAGGFLLEAKDGFLRREVDLGPHETAEIGIGYDIRAASKVVLPF